MVVEELRGLKIVAKISPREISGVDGERVGKALARRGLDTVHDTSLAHLGAFSNFLVSR